MLAPPTHISPPAPFGWQHPFGQVAGLQPVVTPWHSCEPLQVENPSAGQFVHAWPPAPQSFVDVPG
jgi:hypothetical protein